MSQITSDELSELQAAIDAIGLNDTQVGGVLSLMLSYLARLNSPQAEAAFVAPAQEGASN